MNYFIKQTEPGLWTVGSERSDGTWHPREDFDTRAKAEEERDRLNGIPAPLSSNYAGPVHPYAADDEPGMSLREYFAAQALPALINQHPQWGASHTARRAINYADALISELQKQPA